MTCFKRLICASATLLLLAATPLLAQMNPRPTSPASTGTTSPRRGGQQPCWQQAGVSQQVQQQRRQIEQSSEYDPQSMPSSEYERSLHRHYARSHYRQ